MEDMLRKSGLADYYQKSPNLTIVDGYAGYGWFSAALYNTLRPKRHHLLEPSKYGVEPMKRLVAEDPEVFRYSDQDPFQWKAYHHIYKEIPKGYKPNPSEPSRDFLFVANLAYIGGESLAYQYLLTILHRNWLQRYGRVRMLLWMSSAGAEKLTDGLRSVAMQQKARRTISEDETVQEARQQAAKELEGELKEAQQELDEMEQRVVPNKRKMTSLKKRVRELEARVNETEAEEPVKVVSKRYKSTIIRELTCDFRYLIGGVAVDKEKKAKRSPTGVTSLKQAKELASPASAKTKALKFLHPCPYHEQAELFIEEDYDGKFKPARAAASTQGGLVLLELTPKKISLDRQEEWFYVLTRMLIGSAASVGDSLDALGPGASEWLSPKLPEEVKSKKFDQLTLAQIETMVDLFWQWPFKPSCLFDTYEDRVVVTPEEEMLENPSFYDED